jgi:hypothetical protein
MSRLIQKEVIVPASLAEVWDAWTTVAGVTTFLVPALELAISGPFEMYFDRDAPAGFQGSKGCKVLSYLPGGCSPSTGMRRRSSPTSARSARGW